MSNTLTIILLAVAAYLLGSIPSAVWIGKWFFGVDVREHGSHNAGTTNILRVLGWKAAVPVFIIDIAKGVAAVLLTSLTAYQAATPPYFNTQFLMAAAAVVGHIFPVFAGFRGGKGVATTLGAVAAIAPLPAACCLGVFVIVVSISRYVSLGSMIAGLTLPLFAVFVFGERYTPRIVFFIIIALMLIYTHRKNIGRLIHGTENKISFRKRIEPDNKQE